MRIYNGHHKSMSGDALSNGVKQCVMRNGIGHLSGRYVAAYDALAALFLRGAALSVLLFVLCLQSHGVSDRRLSITVVSLIRAVGRIG